MESIVRSTPQLQARYLEKMLRIQELLIGRVAIRLTGGVFIPGDPRPDATVGAAFACMQAARASGLASDQSRPFSSYLDQAMETVQTNISGS